MRTRCVAESVGPYIEDPADPESFNCDLQEYTEHYADKMEEAIAAAEKASSTGEAYRIRTEYYREEYDDWDVLEWGE